MNNSSSKTHQNTQSSTAVNRKNAKHSASVFDISKATSEKDVSDLIAQTREENLKRRQALAEKANQENLAKIKKNRASVSKKILESSPSNSSNISDPSDNTQPPAESAKNIPDPRRTSLINQKDTAIESAFKASKTIAKKSPSIPRMKNHSFFSFKRIILAFGCSAVAVAAIAYFVNLSTPSIAAQVAAIQSDISASTPTFIPRGYSLSSAVSEEGRVIMTFSSSDNKSFVLSQEKSSWDSAGLESNYVKKEYKDYSVIKENGLTLFVSGANCSWVNSGKFFSIKDEGANLTKKKLQDIAKSLK